MSRPVCIVMVKAPRAGEVKTRLVPPLTAAQAADLAACLAADTVAGALRAIGAVIVAYSPAGGREELGSLLPFPSLNWIEQKGENLGQRLEVAVSEALAAGHGPVIVIGTDSPTIPPLLLESSLAELENGEADIVLGPTDDGGYYLIGFQKAQPGLLQDVAWSTPLAFQQTAANAKRRDLRVHELERWYDVDTSADLLRLQEEILSNEAARLRAPSTARWLQAHASVLSALV